MKTPIVHRLFQGVGAAKRARPVHAPAWSSLGNPWGAASRLFTVTVLALLVLFAFDPTVAHATDLSQVFTTPVNSGNIQGSSIAVFQWLFWFLKFIAVVILIGSILILKDNTKTGLAGMAVCALLFFAPAIINLFQTLGQQAGG
jgi:surface polysaccharide O-acyltransferase-like enzyme